MLRKSNWKFFITGKIFNKLIGFAILCVARLLFHPNFLNKDHFELIVNHDQIHFDECKDVKELINELKKRHYEIQSFPGCSTDLNDYLDRLKKDIWSNDRNGTPIKSFGITLRLKKYLNARIESIVNFLSGHQFEAALKKKFSITQETYGITAIQKNLSKYEITPHPDTRRKAMTYLLNINKGDFVEDYNVHTHLLKFKKDYEKIYQIWKEKTSYDRCWVPWDLCKSVKTIKKNNTIVIFPTTNKSLHAVKMDYPHCKFQRTQIYGNLMYKDIKKVPQRNYKELLNEL